METIAEFNDKKGFNVKLTKDKIFVSAIGQEETFALRSVNGVGLYDDIEKYNSELEKNNPKTNKNAGIGLMVFGGVFAIIGLAGQSGPVPIVEGIAFVVGGYFMMNAKAKLPVLDSYFRLMLSGGSREFKFDKTENNAAAVAEFINQVEDTLTAYK
tara:strand:- start:712 stop:1179 length:468 start_codon:yes stop_codon:yes gene_type:complete